MESRLGGGDGIDKEVDRSGIDKDVDRTRGGLGEEYDDQDVGKVRIIEEDDRNGGAGADSSEDVRRMGGVAGGRLGGDGTRDCRIEGIDGKPRPLISGRRHMLSPFTLSSNSVWEFHGIS